MAISRQKAVCDLIYGSRAFLKVDLKLDTVLHNGRLLRNLPTGAMHMGITGQLWKGSVLAYITK